MTGPRLRIRTPSRLHFGLLGWGPDAGRQFGGLGLMIESPAVEIAAEPAPSFAAEGPLSERARRILASVRDRLADLGRPPGPVAIRIFETPPEHVGLGVGTQLSLAIASAVLRVSGTPDPSAEELARIAGRGRRSGIGLHGFHRGGLLLDGGRNADGAIPPLIARHAFPDEWSVVIVQPPGRHGLHGHDEIRAFADLPPVGERLTERLCRIVLLGILPAVVERDLAGFGTALEELQTHVGASFAAAQGGPYSAPTAAAVIRELHREGFVGCGQTSWGPSLYGFSDRPPAEIDGLAAELRRRLGLPPSSLVVTRAANGGATISFT